MEDDTQSDSDSEEAKEEYDVGFSASELYALHGILRYCAIDMDHETAFVAQSLAKHVHDAMSTEEFSNSMEKEIDEFEEMMQQPQQTNPFNGLQGGAFQ